MNAVTKTLAGHEILRLGDDLRYVPSLKRSMRIASRDDFEAGDFRNADVLRVDIVRDYKIEGMKDDSTNYILELSAATKQAGYDKVLYTVRKTDFMPLKQEFFASSGKKLRSMTFSEPKTFGTHVRPSKVMMVNELYLTVDAIEDKLVVLAGRHRPSWGTALSYHPAEPMNPQPDPTDPAFQRLGAWARRRRTKSTGPAIYLGSLEFLERQRAERVASPE